MPEEFYGSVAIKPLLNSIGGNFDKANWKLAHYFTAWALMVSQFIPRAQGFENIVYRLWLVLLYCVQKNE